VNLPKQSELDLKFLSEMSLVFSSHLQFDRLLAAILERVSGLIGAERGFLLLWDEGGKLGIKATHGWEELKKESFHISLNIAHQVVEKGESVYIPDVFLDKRFGLKAKKGEIDFCSVLCLPLKGKKEELIGSLYVERKSGGKGFSEQDLSLLKGLAEQAAIAIENALHFDSATVDRLTGLFLRSYFQETLEAEFRRAQRYSTNLSLIILTVDGLKDPSKVQDSIFSEIGKLLTLNKRTCDVAARYGKEEFAIILPETDLNGALAIAERFRKKVEEHSFPTPQGPLKLTISQGVVSYPESKVKVKEDLLQQAEKALYSAKHEGGNRVCLSEEASEREVEMRKGPLWEISPISMEERELLALYRYTQILNSTLDLELLLNKVMEIVIEFMGVERGALLLLD